MTRALSSGLQTATDFLLVWLAWIDLYRRRLSTDGQKGAELMEKMRPQFNKACEHLAQGELQAGGDAAGNCYCCFYCVTAAAGWLQLMPF